MAKNVQRNAGKGSGCAGERGYRRGSLREDQNRSAESTPCKGSKKQDVGHAKEDRADADNGSREDSEMHKQRNKGLVSVDRNSRPGVSQVENIQAGTKRRTRGDASHDANPGKVHKTCKEDTQKGIRSAIVPLQETFKPAKARGYGCRFCKFLQYVRGADLSTWKGIRKEVLSPKGLPWETLSHKISGIGSRKAKIMFVGEAPGREEDEQKEPFVGACGRILNAQLRRMGIKREDVWITNVIRCRPPNNKSPSYKESIPCSCFLSQEIRDIRPDIIVPLGKVPLQAILGSPTAKITEAQGNPLRSTVAGHDCIVFPVWHPSYVLRSRNEITTKAYNRAFDKLRQVSETGDVERDDGKYITVNDPERCVKIIRRIIRENKITAFDLETSGLEYFAKEQRIACISFANTDKKGYAIPLYINGAKLFNAPEELQKAPFEWTFEQWREVVGAVKDFLKSPVPKIGHNIKFDANWCASILGVSPKNMIADTMLMHYACDENSVHALKPLVMKYTNMGSYDGELEIYKDRHGIKGRYDLIPTSLLCKYAAMDAVATIRLYDAMCGEIEQQDAETENLACGILPRVMRQLHKMEMRGAYLDMDYSNKLHKETAQTLDDLQEKLRSFPAVRKLIREGLEKNKKFAFTVNSQPQMAKLLFEILGYKPIKATKSTAKLPKDQQKPATDRETMTYYSTEKKCEICKTILEIRMHYKLQTAFVEKLITAASSCANGSYVHCNFNAHGTRTGRLSCSNPSLHQIPNKGSGAVKRMFTSRFGDEGCIIQGDFSQIELRLLASLSGDPAMVDAYLNDRDIHLLTTMKIFGCTEKGYKKLEEKGDYRAKMWRTVAKRINFGIAYGIGAEGIMNLLRAEGIRITLNEAKSYIDKFYEAYPRVREWIDLTHRYCKRDAYVKSVYGRYRRLPDVRSEHDDAVHRAFRQGTNFLIQSPASDTDLTAMLLIEAAMRKRKMKSQIILTVHDSIVVDAYRSEAQEIYALMKKYMEHVHKYGHRVWGDKVDFSFLTELPIKADIEVGVNWRDMVKIKNITVEEALKESAKTAYGLDEPDEDRQVLMDMEEELEEQEKDDKAEEYAEKQKNRTAA